MTGVVTIGKVKSPVVTFKGQAVCTTQQLAQFYGCTEKNLSDNFANNRRRFEEGKHFVKIEGEDLQAFKNQPEIIGLVAKRASHLILWTERGAGRHAKMLETDRAWDVFYQLEDAYFSPREREHQAAANDEELSTVHDRLPLLHSAVDMVVRHRLPFNKVYDVLNAFAGCAHFREMTKDEVAETFSFYRRFAAGLDTRSDWQRITDNQVKLQGPPRQMDMIYLLMVAPEPVRVPDRGPAVNDSRRRSKKA